VKTAVSNEKTISRRQSQPSWGFEAKGTLGAKLDSEIPRGLTSPKMVNPKANDFRSPQSVAVVELTYGLTITGWQ